jgi:hypothetical protein
VIAKSTEERDEAAMATENTPIPGTLNNVIQIGDEQIRGVRGTVEETLNALLESEADRLEKRSVMSVPMLGVTPALATTNAVWRRRQAR